MNDHQQAGEGCKRQIKAKSRAVQRQRAVPCCQGNALEKRTMAVSMRDCQHHSENTGGVLMIASDSIRSPEYKPFHYGEIMKRQTDETRTGVCPVCNKPVKVIGWVTHNNHTRHIQARCETCGKKFLAQTIGNITLADRAEDAKKARYGKQISFIDMGA